MCAKNAFGYYSTTILFLHPYFDTFFEIMRFLNKWWHFESDRGVNESAAVDPVECKKAVLLSGEKVS